MKYMIEHLASLDFSLRHKKGFSCASFDFDYSPSMDFCRPSGFLLHGYTIVLYHYHMRTCVRGGVQEMAHTPTLPGKLRLCLGTVLHEVENAVNVLAPICSSWGMPARYTSMRSFFNPQGQEQYAFVRSANVMVSRPHR